MAKKLNNTKEKEMIKFIVELSERLADESDYDDYLKPKLEQLIKTITEQGEEINTLLKAIKEYERGE
jgi:non-homologous end joining protein Ku